MLLVCSSPDVRALVMLRCIRIGLAVTLLASAALCIQAADPASNAAAPAHSVQTASPPSLPASVAAGSLHAAHKARTQARTISAHNRAKAAEFVNHIESLITNLKHKAHLNRLQRKYNATLNAQEDLEEEDEQEEILNSQEEHGGDPRFAQQQHEASAAIQPPHAAAHIPAASAASQRPTTTRHLRIPDEHHTYLDPVSPMETATDDDSFSESPYVLHPINVPSTAASSSGLNFTTFVYPTIQGNVTIFVGITEYPLGKFHFYPSPRDSAEEDISLLKIQHREAMEKANRAEMIRLRNQRLRGRSGVSSFLEMAAEVSAQLNPLCDGVAETSVTAQSFGCLFAQNAGFFDMSTGACMGNVVSADQLINRASPALQSHSHFGLTRKGNFLTGYLTEDQVGGGSIDGGFHELIQGSGWLIREGKQYINESMVIEGLGSGFLAEKAPRNAIGHDSQGRLVMFEADGEEDIQLGLTLYEFADILAHHFDVQNAINVDGGGSSTTVYENAVVDKPTCRDTPVLCERSVTTISCVMP